MKKPAFNSWSRVRTLLMASLGFNLALGVAVCSRYLPLDASTLDNAKEQYQNQLMNWKPFKEELEPEVLLEGEDFLTEDLEESPSEFVDEETPVGEVVHDETMDSLEIEEESEVKESEEEQLKPELNTDDSTVMGFSIHSISDSLKESLEELAPVDETVITYDDLRLVKVLYWGFDQQTHMGELIVHESVASEVQDIFTDIYTAKFPIEKIRLISEYENSDEDSMKDNNTSGFNYRPITDGEEWSLHAYGLAIDLNPKMNPYVSEDGVLPENAMAYVDRNQTIPGMIQKGDAVYQAFTSRGWTWGGDWSSLKDYQHFSKPLK